MCVGAGLEQNSAELRPRIEFYTTGLDGKVHFKSSHNS